MPDPTVPVPIPDLLAAKGGHVPPIDPIRLRAIEHLIGVLQERARTATTRTIEVEAFSVLTVVDGTEDLIRGVRDLAARVETLEQENRDALRAVADAKLAIAEAKAANTIARAEVDYARAALAGQSTTETPS